MKFGKKLLVWVIAGAIVYFFLGYHVIFIENTVRLLKKSSFTLNYTLFSAKGKTNESILSIDELREVGGSGVVVMPVTYIFEEEPAAYREMIEKLKL